jgi:PII-like signaling protein
VPSRRHSARARLTSYFGERHRTNGTSAGNALIDLSYRQEIAASILLRGIQGFGLKQRPRTNSSLSLSEDLPLTAIAVDTRPNIEAILDQTLELKLPGLITLEKARLLSGEIDPLGIADNAGEATKLTVYFGRHDSVYAVPAYEVICELLHRRGHADLPMMVIAVGSGGQLGMLLPELGGLLRHPLITLEQVRICKRDGQFLNRPRHAHGADYHGFPFWQKVTVYTSEATQHKGQPVHRAIMGRLRSAGVSGVTTHVGIWGFHGERPPHGDHLLQLARHVPAVTTVIDTPERISGAFDVIDELTSEHGLVTSETVLAMRATSAHRQPGER